MIFSCLRGDGRVTKGLETPARLKIEEEEKIQGNTKYGQKGEGL